MILRSATVSSAILCICAHAATITGSVELQGSKVAGRDATGVVVWLEPQSGTAAVPAPKNGVIIQKEKAFIPHVLAIPVNSTVDFPNLDPIFHNAFSNFEGQIFDVGLYPPGKSRKVKFRRAGVVRVFCNIHPAMSALIVVLKTPHYDVTNDSGAFRITDVPAGDYVLKVFHERATPATLSSLERRITVQSDAALPRIVISEAGYITLPHKNKYGKDYPAAAEHGTYPGRK